MRMGMSTKCDLSRSVVLRPVGIDDMSSVRYVHATAFRILAAEHHSDEQLAARVAEIMRPDYVREVLDSALYCAWVDGEIVGTAGWCPADDNGKTARIRKVYVRPLFTNCGIGGLLLRNAEERACRSGFVDFSVRANVNAIAFYKQAGYEITSHGVMPTYGNIDLPVAFMRKKARVTSVDLRDQAKAALTATDGGRWWQ